MLTSKGHVRKLSDGFLADARSRMAEHSLSLISPTMGAPLCGQCGARLCALSGRAEVGLLADLAEQLRVGLFDLVGVDVIEGAEVARHTMCNQMAATCDEGVRTCTRWRTTQAPAGCSRSASTRPA